MTETEINELVARKLGWKSPISNQGTNLLDTPDFCHSIEAAWELTKEFKGELMLVQYKNEWVAKWGLWKTARADTAPMAICLAFLKLP